MESSWKSQIEAWDTRVKAGDGHAVAREIALVPRGKMPVEMLSQVANIAWRVNRPDVGLRLLYSELRRQNNLKIMTHPRAFTEYAACLLEVGAIAEAKRILIKLQDSAPRSKFYYALLLFKEWDYKTASHLLEKYVSEIPNDYHQIVARVNLSSAYVNTQQWEKAHLLLKDLQAELASKEHWLLLGNCLEIESQIHFELQNFEEALNCLKKSEIHLSKTKNMGWLYCKKWQFLNRLYQSKSGIKTQAMDMSSTQFRDFECEILELRKLAIQMRSWETLRELDLHWALQTGDSQLITHVYFGSPEPRYRQKISQMTSAKPNMIVADTCVWLAQNGRGIAEDSPDLIDISRTVLSGKENSQSYLMKKLLLTLVSDFYAPFRVGQLFSALFENDFYDTETSPDRIFQIVRRLRAWLMQNHPGCEVVSSAKAYRLRFAASCGVKLSREIVEAAVKNKSNVHYLFLREHFHHATFSSVDLSARLRCSTRTANRVLKELKCQGKVLSEGRGRFTRFKLAS